jgi:hypothetical protein
MRRREFCCGLAIMAAATCTRLRAQHGELSDREVIALVKRVDSSRVIGDADAYLKEAPQTIMSWHSDRSPGGPHDYFSEGDYWWPNPKDSNGPYIRRDGQSNPENFVAHREALIRLSLIVPALVIAWKLTGKRAYAARAREHLVSWFVAPATRMNPNLQYAQAIKGISKGRGTGIIDTIHLVEVTKAAKLIQAVDVWSSPSEYDSVQAWFREYLDWMATSKNGIEERDAKNNHGSCWVLQAAAFSAFVADREKLQFCAERFKNDLIPEQVAENGSLPLELARTKPYSYSLFDMDILSGICQIISAEGTDLWKFSTGDGRSMQKVIAYMVPFIEDKRKWPKPPDVEYFNDLPVRQPSLLFGGIAYGKPQWIDIWKRLNPEPKVPEIIRNFPIRQPLLWI